jgi:hypothetical protein
VYKATKVSRPHFKMSVMSDEEVRKHQKSESVEAVMQKHVRKPLIFGFKMKDEKEKCATMSIETRESEDPVEVVVPEDVFEILNPAGETKTGSKKEKKERGVFDRVKKAIKEVFHFELVDSPKKAPVKMKTTTRESTIQQGAMALEHRRLRSGFHCKVGECEGCAPPAPSTLPTVPAGVPAPAQQVRPAPLSHADAVANVIEQLIPSSKSSFDSGITSSSSSTATPSNSNDSLDPFTRRKPPKIYIPSTPSDYGTPNTIDHSVFDKFSGVHCQAEETPPQIAPLRPVSSFNDKLKGTTLSSDFSAFNSSSSILPYQGGSSKDEQLTSTPALSTSPDPSSTPLELSTSPDLTSSSTYLFSTLPSSSPLPSWSEGHVDTPTHCPKPWENERLWFFDLVAPGSAFSVPLGRGDEARERRRGRRVLLSSEGGGEGKGEIEIDA